MSNPLQFWVPVIPLRKKISLSTLICLIFVVPGVDQWPPSVCGRHQRSWPAPRSAGKLLVCSRLLQSGLQRSTMAEGERRKNKSCTHSRDFYRRGGKVFIGKRRHCSHTSVASNSQDKMQQWLLWETRGFSRGLLNEGLNCCNNK